MNEDVNEQILSELRSLRRHTQLSAYMAIVCVAIAIGFGTWLRFERERSSRAYYQSRSAAQPGSSVQPSQETVWPTIEAALDQGDNRKALTLAQSFVARQPRYHYSHATLGSVYVAIGDYTNAEAAYMKAVELYPFEDHEKALASIRKRLATDRGTSAQAR